ncbi:DUF1697 domain-containing protein [Arthrobacter sp. MSA 4-2]|uniref:DUF1697 domain-containing protein n=1 Tax=Arthrobacter sp. MSA 4-2 TaxID=2794349 RepID=UPI0027DB6468|nr:DUF1697 domain-containing protein [Arthrobacter sp. MSA 4-2]
MTAGSAAEAVPWAVFLRGVNVQGTTIRMADLLKALKGLPLANPRTLLASGNLVCTSALGAQELKDAVEQRLRSAFGYDAWVVVLPAARLTEIIEACPFPADDPAVHAYVTLSSDPAAVEELAAAARAAGEALTVLGPDAVAWQAARGGTLDSGLGKITARGRFKAATTTRNLRTLVKVSAAMAG